MATKYLEMQPGRPSKKKGMKTARKAGRKVSQNVGRNVGRRHAEFGKKAEKSGGYLVKTWN